MITQDMGPPGQTPARSTDSAASASESTSCAVRELLGFRLGGEEYGIDLLRVQEIRSFHPPTRIAGAPPHVLGVVNLRGVIVPIVDLRWSVGLDKPVFDALRVIVVLNVHGRVFGAVVDAVSDVVEVSPAQMRDLPEMQHARSTDIACGLAVLDTRMLILVDADGLPRQLLDLPCGDVTEGRAPAFLTEAGRFDVPKKNDQPATLPVHQ